LPFAGNKLCHSQVGPFFFPTAVTAVRNVRHMSKYLALRCFEWVTNLELGRPE
jgi:hypothetical protein